MELALCSLVLLISLQDSFVDRGKVGQKGWPKWYLSQISDMHPCSYKKMSDLLSVELKFLQVAVIS